jgi:hypothetical protein
MKNNLIVVLLLLFGCLQKENMKQCEWILGNWKFITDRGTFYESWEKQDVRHFKGRGCFVIKGDTVFKEALMLENKNGGIFYIPTIGNKNEKKPVEFMMMAMGKELIFENLSHDFPKRIVYQYADDDHIMVTLSGLEKGEVRKEVLNFIREH